MKPSEAIRLGLVRRPFISRDVFCDEGRCGCVLGCILDRDGRGFELQERYEEMPARGGRAKFDVLVDDPELKVFSLGCPEEVLEELKQLVAGNAGPEAWGANSLGLNRMPLSLGSAMALANDSTTGSFDPRPAIADILEKHGY